MAGELALWDITTTKDESASSTAQVPTTATVKVYREGAWGTAETHTAGAGNVTVNVDDIGGIRVGDTLQPFDETVQATGLDTTVYTVQTIVSQTQFTASITATFTATAATRFIITNDRPLTYTDDRASAATGTASQISTDADTGYGYFYTVTRNFDVIVLVTSANATLLPDQTGGQVSADISLREEGVLFNNTDSDASTNVTAMQQAFDQVGRSGFPVSTIIASRGTAYLDEDIVIDNGGNNHISLVGEPGSIIKAKSGFTDANLFNINTASSHDTLWLKGIEIDATDIASLDIFDASAHGYENVVVENCFFYNCKGQGLIFGKTGTDLTTALRHFHIVGNRFEAFSSGTGSDAAISIISGVFGEISGNTFYNHVDRGISIVVPATTDYARQLTIADNHFSVSSDGQWTGNGIHIVGQATDEDNDTREQSFGIQISGNTLVGPGNTTQSGSGVYVQDCQHVTITGNHYIRTGASGYAGFQTVGCRNVVFSNNNVDGATGSEVLGIRTADTNEVAISGNLIADCYEGILVQTSDSVVLSGNNVHDCNALASGGIVVAGACAGVTITGNRSTNNPYGVQFTGTSTDCLVVGNDFSDSATFGLETGTTTDIEYGLNLGTVG